MTENQTMPAVRVATPSDVGVLARLRFRFRTELGEPTEEEEAFVERCAAWMAERLATPGPWRCWVAEGSSGIVGNLWLEVVEKMPNPVDGPERHVYITNVYVLPGGRDGGVGGLLMDAAIEWCKGAEIDATFLWPSPRSRSFYMRYGFAPRDDMFSIR